MGPLIILTPEQIKTIEAQLEGKGTHPVLILYTANDWERKSEKLSIDFEALLAKLNWTVERKSW